MYADLAGEVGTALTGLLPAVATVVGVIAGIVAAFGFAKWVLKRIKTGAQGRA